MRNWREEQILGLGLLHRLFRPLVAFEIELIHFVWVPFGPPHVLWGGHLLVQLLQLLRPGEWLVDNNLLDWRNRLRNWGYVGKKRVVGWLGIGWRRGSVLWWRIKVLGLENYLLLLNILIHRASRILIGCWYRWPVCILPAFHSHDLCTCVSQYICCKLRIRRITFLNMAFNWLLHRW